MNQNEYDTNELLINSFFSILRSLSSMNVVSPRKEENGFRNEVREQFVCVLIYLWRCDVLRQSHTSFNLYPESSGSLASGWLAEETLSGKTMQSRYGAANQTIIFCNYFRFPQSLLTTNRWLKSLETLGTGLDQFRRMTPASAWAHTKS